MSEVSEMSEMNEMGTLTQTVTGPRLRRIPRTIGGYGSMVSDQETLDASPDGTTEEYACEQLTNNARVTHDYLEVLCRRAPGRTILDVGCGVGTSVMTLLEDGFDAYGVDLAPLTRFWAREGRLRNRFFVVDPGQLALPFEDDTIDLAFSFGVLEHVGTVDGHATRRDDYHAWRRKWLLEIFRTVRPGGYLLMGGPNRNFPVDASHGLDSRASRVEKWLSDLAGVSIHKTWGDYFLWGFRDFDTYLSGQHYEVEALSIRSLLLYSRAPQVLRPLVRFYVNHLPRPLLKTGFNPWVMALIRKL